MGLPAILSTRFNFVQRNVGSSGMPPFYDVIDGGGSINSRGVTTISSGRTIGQIQFDNIMRRWGFVQQEKGIQVSPAGFDAGSSDGKLISDFIATLAVPSLIVPAMQ